MSATKRNWGDVGFLTWLLWAPTQSELGKIVKDWFDSEPTQVSPFRRFQCRTE